MVIFDNNFRSKYVAAVKKSRAEKIRVVRLESGLFYVTRGEGHGRYIVTVEDTKRGFEATCKTTRGSSCPSYGCCVHLAATFEYLIADGQRKLNKENAK